MKSKWLSWSTTAIVLIFVFGLFSKTSSLFLYLSDRYFLLSLILSTIGLLMLVLKDGTFDFFHYGLNRAKNYLFQQENNDVKKNRPMPASDDLHRLSQSIPSAYTACLKAGALFFVLSALCILLFYLNH